MGSYQRLLVTGGAGFIGSAFVRHLLKMEGEIDRVVNMDLLTYAGNLQSLKSVENDPRYLFVHGDICNGPFVQELIMRHSIEAIVHFAAESHVDRSIDDPREFYRTNVGGTLSLLEIVRLFPHVHFHHVSTDEVYGSIEKGRFTEESPYAPNSPYAASKAAADHFVRAYHKTYGISVTISHSGNNFGPCQHPEKFIPKMVTGCIYGRPLPLFGNGTNVRDWLFVEDHVEAIWRILKGGRKGESYNISGDCEKKNCDLLREIIQAFSQIKQEPLKKFEQLIQFVEDRPGHDFRYALSGEKMARELNWRPRERFDEGLKQTIQWYLHQEVS